MDIKYSAAVHTYNRANVICETIDAILGQSYPPSEIIILDDGSTDNTEEVLKKYGDKIYYEKISNVGCGAARKAAIERCNHEWIALCDSDDIWHHDHLERRTALIEAFPDVSYTFSDFDSIGTCAQPGYHRLAEAPEGWIQKVTQKNVGDFIKVGDPYLAFLEFNPAFMSGVAFRIDAYRKMGGINTEYSRRNSEDTDFTRRFLLLPDVVVAGDTQATWSYRRESDNMSLDQHRNIMGKARILEDHLHAGIVPAEYKQKVTEEILKTKKRAFYQAFYGKAYKDVREFFSEIPARDRTMHMYLRYLASRFR
jgi:glycosyltransferase involved in cell wall biosynthesis